LTGLEMGTLLDPAEPEVAAAVDSTRAIFERLGARPYLDRLDVAVAASGAAPSRARTARPVAPEVAVSE